MSESLSEVERRVLGVLLEKSLAQPQYYPMSVNAIVTACNQKSNRDPVMSLDEDSVWDTLERLRAVGLVSRLMPGGASRVDRFRHEVKTLLGWEKPQWAVMAELLLRGPQTVGELRSRCNRMYRYENTDAVAAVLDILRESDPPRVAMLPRGAGQSAVRWGHQLYYPEEWRNLAGIGADTVESAGSSSPAVTPSSPPAAPAAVTPVGADAQPESPVLAITPAASPSSTTPAASPAPPPPATPSGEAASTAGNVESEREIAALRSEVEGVQGELADLHEALADLRRRMERVEERI